MSAMRLPCWECAEAAATKIAVRTRRATVMELGRFMMRGE